MAKQTINFGTTINDGTGDTLRAGAQKINANFTELYDAFSADGTLSVVSGVVAGNGISVSNPYGSVTVNALPASETQAGVIKVGSGLTITDGILSATAYSLPKAASNILGGIKVGDNLTINNEGVLSAVATPYTLPTASPTTKGGIKVGDGLEIVDGVLKVASIGIASALESGNAILTYSEVEGLTHSILQSDFGVSLFTTGEINYTSLGWTDGTEIVNQVTVTSAGISMYHQNITDEITTQWQFRNDGILLGPTIALGTLADQTQIIAVQTDESITLGNYDLKSYVRVESPINESAPHVIRINSNIVDDYVEGLGYTSPGGIELNAGGIQSETRSGITMGTLVADTSHDFPPAPVLPTATLTTNMEIVGGTAFYGDVYIAGGSILGIRTGIVFQDGTIQTTAYQGESPADISSLNNGSFSVELTSEGLVTIPSTLTSTTNLILESIADLQATAGEDVILTSSVGFALRNYSTTDGISIVTSFNDEAEKIWTFNASGSLTMPSSGDGLTWNNPDEPPMPLGGWHANSSITIEKDAGLHITHGIGGLGSLEWIFKTDGSIQFPDSTVQTTAYTRSLTLVETVGGLIDLLEGADTIQINEAPAYVYEGIYTISFVDRVVSGQRTLVINNTDGEIALDFGSGTSGFIIPALTVMEAVYTGAQFFIISERAI
jgi:hypothetical protein